MKIYFLTDEALSVIKENIDFYLDYFKESSNESLIKRVKEASQKEEIFKATSYDVVDNIEEILINNISGAGDTKNAILLHEVLKDLPPTIACDERFWAGFAIHSCWNFVRKRWHMEEDVTKSGVLSHFLFMGQRTGLTRNALARPWWLGHLTYDETRQNRYELTELVCESSDYILNLFERSFSNSSKVLQAFVETIHELRKEYNMLDSYPKSFVREMCKYVNLLGGIYILEALPEEVLKAKMKARAKAYLEK